MTLKNVLILLGLALVLENATTTKNLGVMLGYNIVAMLQNSGELADCLMSQKPKESIHDTLLME